MFAYLASYLIVTTESLRYINSQLSVPVSAANFRPNIVIENSVPFDEVSKIYAATNIIKTE